MTRAELKKQAKDTLRGRWGTIIGMVVLYAIIIGGIEFACNFIPFIGPIAVIIITVPLSYGFIGQLLKFSRNEEVGLFDFFSLGFNNFSKSWLIVGNILLKLAVYYFIYIVMSACMIVVLLLTWNNSGADLYKISMAIYSTVSVVLYILIIIKSYLYVLSEYIGNDITEMPAKEVVNKSAELMKGHRLELFVLQLSFIGWAVLSLLTCGIGFLWLFPYMEITTIKFYENLKNDTNDNKNVEVISEN